MAVVVALVNLLIIIISQPWNANPPTGDIGHTLNPSELEFIDDEDESCIPWMDTLVAIKIICLLFLAKHQLSSMKLENEEVEEFMSKCYEDHTDIHELTKFYGDTEKVFPELERKSKAINKRLLNAEKLTQNNKGCDKIQEDLDFVRESWFQQFSAFNLLDIDIDAESITDGELKTQIEAIKEHFDGELHTVASHMDEDRLSLEEVVRDTQILHNYIRGSGNA